MSYPGKEAFFDTLRSVSDYELPEATEVGRKLSCASPDYRGFAPYRLRFLLGESGVVFDILPPGPVSDINPDSVLVMQMRQLPSGQVGFPDGDLPIVLDSQLQLDRTGPRMLVARSELFSDWHEDVLVQAGLGEVVVANLTLEYSFGTPYGSSVAPDIMQRDISALPERLLALAAPLQ